MLLQALSNQKYCEMYEQFQDVRLMTGDATINPSASCLIMTTEVSVSNETYASLFLKQLFVVHVFTNFCFPIYRL